MTIQEEAMGLINRMPDERVVLLVEIIKSLPPSYVYENQATMNRQSDEFIESEMKLKEIAELQYDWNGNRADAFSEKLIHKIYTLLMLLEKQPEIFPTACDTIQLEYDHEGNHLEIEIGEDDAAELFLVNADGIEQTELIDGDARTINMIIRRFYGKDV